MQERPEHEPVRRVVLHAAPAPRTEAPRSGALVAGVVAVLVTLTVFAVLVLAGNVVWDSLEPPDRTPEPPTWMKPTKPGGGQER